MALSPILGIVVLAPGPADAQWIKLSDGASFSDVEDFKISPDGDRVVYRQDPVLDTARELYSVPIGGGTPVRLSGALPSGSQVARYEISPDGVRVVYTAPQDTGGVFELYSVPIGGGAPIKLNDPLPSGADVFDLQITPDSGRVVYLADQETQDVRELFSVPITGGTVLKINGALGGFTDVDSFQISPNSSRVVYRTETRDPGGNEFSRLYSVPIGGGTVVQVNGTLFDSRFTFEISPDSARIVYLADAQEENVTEVFSVPIGGGASVKLNGTLVEFGDVFSFRISPDSARVVYRATQQSSSVNELYTVPIAGGAAVKLNSALVGGGDVFDFEISPDSARVIYRADQLTNDLIELFSVPIAGGAAPVKLNDPIGPTGGDVQDFKISPDSSWVVYRADPGIAGIFAGLRAPIAGPTGSAEAIWTTPAVSSRFDYQIDAASRFVFVRGGANLMDAIDRLWQVNLAGTPFPRTVELIPVAEFPPGGEVSDFGIGSVVYIADQETDNVFELYSIPLLFLDGFETGDTSVWD